MRLVLYYFIILVLNNKNIQYLSKKKIDHFTRMGDRYQSSTTLDIIQSSIMQSSPKLNPLNFSIFFKLTILYFYRGLKCSSNKIKFSDNLNENIKVIINTYIFHGVSRLNNVFKNLNHD